MNWQSYEKLVKDIYEQLGRSAGVRVESWGRLCKVEGKSGVRHQIDVLTAHSDGVHEYKTAIECKHWNKKIDKDAISKLLVILEDTKIEKGVVVSQFGFTPDARKLAEYKNISLVELRKPVDDDWDGLIKDVHINVHLEVPETYDFRFVQGDVRDESKKENLRVLNSDVLVHIINEKSISLHEITSRILSAPTAAEGGADTSGFCWSEVRSPEDDERAFAVRFPDDTTLSVPIRKGRARIREIHFKVRHKISTESIEIRSEDYVSMTMHTIFENKRFAVAPDGTVRSF